MAAEIVLLLLVMNSSGEVAIHMYNSCSVQEVMSVISA